MRHGIMFSLLAVVLAGCAEEDELAPPSQPGIGEVVVYEAGPHVRQCEGPVITRTQSAAKLTRAGIEVRRSGCGHVEGVAYPAVCGAGTGEILLHDIPSSHLETARAAGFEDADKLNDPGRDIGWRRGKCPQYLHALEVAQSSPECAGIRNRVVRIQSNASPDQRVVLLDQAGHCADAAYRQVLFGADGDNVLCSNEQTIAGPRKSCPVPAFAAMFDIILDNLGEDDLGLGSGYYVSQLPIP